MLNANQLRLQPLDFIVGHLPQLRIGIVEHGTRFVVVALGLLIVAILGDDVFELGALLSDFAIRLAVGNDGRIRHLARQVVKPGFHIVELLRILHDGLQRGPDGLSDHQLAALRFFELHRAVERLNRDTGLLVGWRLCSYALQPQTGRGERGH